MTKITVEFDASAEHADEGKLLLDMEKVLRLLWPGYDLRVLKSRQRDDSPLRIARSA